MPTGHKNITRNLEDNKEFVDKLDRQIRQLKLSKPISLEDVDPPCSAVSMSKNDAFVSTNEMESGEGSDNYWDDFNLGRVKFTNPLSKGNFTGEAGMKSNLMGTEPSKGKEKMAELSDNKIRAIVKEAAPFIITWVESSNRREGLGQFSRLRKILRFPGGHKEKLYDR